MSRPDERAPRRPLPDGDAPVDPAADDPAGGRPASKTRRKAEMHALQDVGEALVQLEPKRLAELATDAALPDRLVDAIREARSITAWGGRKRALQFVGKLMRDIDPEPIRKRLALWAHGHDVDTARQHALEQWRERLVAEPNALDALAARFPRLDRPRFRALIAKARDERGRGGPPHAFRELFRELKSLDITP
jgi:ribosome-associated protein